MIVGISLKHDATNSIWLIEDSKRLITYHSAGYWMTWAFTFLASQISHLLVGFRFPAYQNQ